MSLLTPEIEKFVGVESKTEVACDMVERGAIRRHSQAIMDDDTAYHDEAVARERGFGSLVAPPLYPMTMFRRDFATPDAIQDNAENPDFDGIVDSTAQGLPALPLKEGISLLNAGTEIELFRYAERGERITAKSRYDQIYEKEGRSGPMLFVVIEIEYRNAEDDLLMRVKKTQIRR
jgi:hypothetical protein